jgi:hypothetical protein
MHIAVFSTISTKIANNPTMGHLFNASSIVSPKSLSQATLSKPKCVKSLQFVFEGQIRNFMTFRPSPKARTDSNTTLIHVVTDDILYIF